MIEADCPSCGSKILLSSNPRLGQRVVCRECQVEVEVVWLAPIELDWPYDEDEDEDEFDDWDDEED